MPSTPWPAPVAVTAATASVSAGHPRSPSLPTHSLPPLSPSLTTTSSLTSTVSRRAYIAPFIVLAGIVLASVTQTEVAAYLSSSLHYDRPYFTFYVTHATFTLVFPLHLAVLALIPTPRGGVSRVRAHLKALRAVLADQVGTSARWRVLARPWARKVYPLTALISAPSLCWYIAMALAPAMDITAIYATSAFHTYFFSMILLGQKLTRATVLAIAVAFAGVVVLTLDSAGGSSSDSNSAARLAGDVIMIFGAVALGLYEVIYKLVLPEGHGGVTRARQGDEDEAGIESDTSAEAEDDDIVLGAPRAGSLTPLLPKPQSASSRSSSPSPVRPPIRSTPSNHSIAHAHHHHQHLPPHLPAALHANFLTSSIGLATLIFLWIPVPFLDYTGLEHFLRPRGWDVWGALGVVAMGGSLYNAGLMVLIGMWGPTTSSVANLLTIGLVAVADALWMGRVPDIQTLLGTALICIGFGALLWEGEG